MLYYCRIQANLAQTQNLPTSLLNNQHPFFLFDLSVLQEF